MSRIHYTNQNYAAITAGISGSPDTFEGCMPTQATTSFVEYRIDWVPGKTMFYIDGVLQTTLTQYVPQTSGVWIWNNWSNGAKDWSAGPPAQDNVLEIQRIEMYYNSTSNARCC